MSDLRPGTTMYRIAELERVTREQRQDIRELRGPLELAEGRIATLERSAPEARQLQHEADLAAADLAESGYDRHGPGCQCSYCYVSEPCGRCGSADPDLCGCFDNDDAEPEPEEYDPGPKVDDEGGMSEYRYAITAGEDPL